MITVLLEAPMGRNLRVRQTMRPGEERQLLC